MTWDVLIEFVNGETTWLTIDGQSEAEVDDWAWDYHENVADVEIHPWGTRPGERRQGRPIT